MINIKKSYKDLKDITNFSYEISGISKGFGNTVGNSIRRAIISNTPGLAVCAYSLSCFTHEFDKNSAVVEDAGEVLYKMKDVVFQYDEEVVSETIQVELQGPMQVTAAILETDKIKVINKDLVLFNISKKTKLVLQVFVNSGVGFITHQENSKKITGEAIIACTSFYSRIEKVSYKIEVNEISEDKGEILFLSIDAAKCYSEDFILKNAFSKIINEFSLIFEGIDKEVEVENHESQQILEQISSVLEKIIPDEELRTKIINLKSATFEDLISRLGDAKVQKQLGVKKIQIKEILSKIKETLEADET